MVDGYDSHGDVVLALKAEAEARCAALTSALQQAFQPFIRSEAVEVVFFSEMTADHIAAAFTKFPLVVKAVLTACNIAARAIERDLGLKNLDTYKPRLSDHQAVQLAAYVKPFLPQYIAIPALCSLDQHFYVDKEMRAFKGRWEKLVLKSLNEQGREQFKKRHFEVDGQVFELDAATPEKGTVLLGVDIKRIEARRDIHKRCDEIVNKANKFRVAFPQGKFAAVVYYPFIDEHLNVQHRLKAAAIEIVVFAGSVEESIDNAVQTLLLGCEMAKE